MGEVVKRALLSTVLLVGAATWLSAAEPAVVVVVHPDSQIRTIRKAELSKIFLKRLRTWQDGSPVEPVDQAPDSLARREFSRLVHRRSVVNIEVYWKRMIFSGRSVPPPEVTGDDKVLEYVRSTPGAVGYVTRRASSTGVRRLVLIE